MAEKAKKKRLGRQDWINAGFRALVSHGAEGLRVERIAQALDMTKGSFYWHFKDLPALHSAMLAYWEDAATHRIIARVEESPPGMPRLMALADAVNMPHEAQGGAGAEAAIRGWGRVFAPASEVVARVDAQRLDFLRDCLADMDVDDPTLPVMIYATHLGLEQLSTTPGVDPIKTLTHLIKMIGFDRPAMDGAP